MAGEGEHSSGLKSQLCMLYFGGTNMTITLGLWSCPRRDKIGSRKYWNRGGIVVRDMPIFVDTVTLLRNSNNERSNIALLQIIGKKIISLTLTLTLY